MNKKAKSLSLYYILMIMFLSILTFSNISNKTIISNNKLLSTNKNNTNLIFKQSSMGYFDTSLIVNDGTYDHLYMWGQNEFGELGTGDTEAKLIPTEISIGGSSLGVNETVKEISLGDHHSSAVINDGTYDHLYMWGNNNDGQLGTGDTEAKLIPTEITTGEFALSKDETIKQISMGYWGTSAAIVNDGTYDHLYMWGNNDWGQLGLGDKENRLIPTEVSIDNSSSNQDITIKQIDVGADFAGAIINDGTIDHLYMWGSNDENQLGLDILTIEEELIPTDITVDSYELTPNQELKNISLGFWHSSIVLFDGTSDQIYMWGDNSVDQLGLEIGTFHSPPKLLTKGDFKLTGNQTIIQIFLGGFFSSAIMNDGTTNHLYLWGDNEYGELGIGDDSISINSPTELSIGEGLSLKQVSLGYVSSSAIVNDGNSDILYMWGFNEDGELGIGDGDFKSKYSPVLLDNSNSNSFSIVGEPSNIFLSEGGWTFDIDISEGILDGTITSIDLSIDTGSVKVEGGGDLVIGKNSLIVSDLKSHDFPELMITLHSSMEDQIKKIKEIYGPMSITGLENARTNTAPTKTSVGIYVEVLSEEPTSSNYIIKKFSLEMVDENDSVIGSTDAIDLNETGPQEFTLSNLTEYTEYSHVKVRVSGNHSIVSNDFSFVTQKKSIFSLENAKVTDVTFNSATISVDSLVESGLNTPVQDYILIVKNTLNGQEWKSDILNESGTQKISIDNLNSDYSYNEGDIIVSVEGIDISTSVEAFKTKVSPIIVDPDSFLIDNDSITKNSFTFTINISINDGYEGFVPQEDLYLSSNGDNELNTTFMSKEEDTYTYGVSDLHWSKKYSDFKIKIDELANPIIMKSTSIKTKRNVVVFYSILFLVIGAFLTFIIVMVSLIRKYRRVNGEYNSIVDND